MHFIIEFKLPHSAGKYAISEQKALVISSAPAIQKSVKLWLPFVPSFLFGPGLPFRKRRVLFLFWVRCFLRRRTGGLSRDRFPANSLA